MFIFVIFNPVGDDGLQLLAAHTREERLPLPAQGWRRWSCSGLIVIEISFRATYIFSSF
jgi:hypothetical protein